MSENQTVEDYPCRRCQVFIGEIVASLNIDDSFQCKRTFAHGVLGGGNQPEAVLDLGRIKLTSNRRKRSLMEFTEWNQSATL